MKTQQKEYEEIINAELAMAQRYEAAELRCNEESSRRKIQDKSRKAEMKAAHQKLNARFISKNYCQTLRERALSQLTSMSIIVPPQKSAMQSQVVPYLMGVMMDSLVEDQITV